MDKKIYYKELAHMIMKAGKSEDLQSGLASWRHRRASSIFPIQMLVGLRSGKSQHFHLSPKTGKSQYPSSKTIRQEEFFLTWRDSGFWSIHNFNWVNKAHPH